MCSRWRAKQPPFVNIILTRKTRQILRMMSASRPSRRMAPTRDPAMIQGTLDVGQLYSSEFSIRTGTVMSILKWNSTSQPSNSNEHGPRNPSASALNNNIIVTAEIFRVVKFLIRPHQFNLLLLRFAGLLNVHAQCQPLTTYYGPWTFTTCNWKRQNGWTLN